MLLKSMEIRGFKSFADKTDLHFKKGVTAVVGPNGSGKSNISDAVRWVLGEQSVKSLRGGKMEDVIFAGTQFRKPVGLAQVAITLDNTTGELPVDYSDVTISRRLYRSGDSEYYINNTQCRLKDIQELFMDTGIGKEGYSIIGQGKIDAILSGKPEERRNLLEEAAGIVKFKTRRDEAQKKLEATNLNLVRINDILNTYEERLEPLRAESEKANLFLSLSNELKIKEINLIINSISSIQRKMEDIQGSLTKIDFEIQSLNEERQNSKSKLSSAEVELEEHEKRTEEINKEFFFKKQEQQSADAEIKLLSERFENLLSQISKSECEIKDVEKKITDLENNKSTQEETLNTLQQKQKILDSTIQGQEAELLKCNVEINSIGTELETKKDEEFEYINKISEHKNSILLMKSQEEQLQQRVEQIHGTCENYKASTKINLNTKFLLEEQSQQIKQRVENFEKEIQEFKHRKTEAIADLSSKEKLQNEKNSLLNKLESDRNLLLSLDKQYEGYNRPSKILMQDIQKGKVSAVSSECYILGEIIEVKKELEVAIEIALGGAISDIITPEESTAKKLINYLKENRIGRATFLPLSIIKPRVINETQRFSNIEGFIGLGSELVSFDNKFKAAVEFVLGRTIIAESMDSALSIAQRSNYNYRIVTLAGEVINPGGSMTGGSLQVKSSNLIGRKREIEELNIKVSHEKNVVNELSDAIARGKVLIKELDDNILNIRDLIYAENIESTKIVEKITSLDREGERLKENLNIANNEISLIKAQIQSIKRDIDEKNINLERLIENSKQNEIRIVDLNSHLEIKKVDMHELREGLTEKKIEKAQVDEIVLNLIKELERYSKEIYELTNKRNVLKDFIRTSEYNKAECLDKVQQLNVLSKSLESDVVGLENQFKEREFKKIELKNYVSKILELLEQTTLINNKKDEEKHRLQLQAARLEAEKESVYIKLNEEMQLTYAEAIEYKVPVEEFSVEKFKREASEIKGKISSLGTVNVGAIEEYKEVKEKHAFMSTQREDLIKSIEELDNVIFDLTEKMKRVFNENFEKLRSNFNETFVELFKGGSADLILADGDELTSNIDINVQPPGKKLQNINLMSGGEKVLSAIALLFAILKMKPTPFCILDEIEAALDDANVFRYAEFLKKFSHNIQFIVITHRKGTMECSDVLYGVTMEEKGVSKIVSVDLSKR